MKVAYYPGCSLHSTGIEYDISARKLCAGLGIELAELKKWICCGSSPAHQCDELMSLSLPARNLSIAAEEEASELCAPCASCYSRLRFAQERAEDDTTRAMVEEVVGRPFPQGIRVFHLAELIFEKIGTGRLAERVTRSLGGMRLGCYYGCLMTRPPKVTHRGDFENPGYLDELLEAAGAECVDWNLKTFCCGAAFALTETPVVLELTRKILADVCRSGAEAVVVGCPLCHSNLDTRQTQINAEFGTDFNVPIFYFTELLGIALGIDATELGVARHLTGVEEFLKERSLL